MPIRQKLPVRESIPTPFVEFMREVAAAIEEGDASAWTESDDLLQFARGYGGLYDESRGRYGFEYLVEDDEEVVDEQGLHICWYFDLDRPQIRDIASGVIKEIQLWRCEPDCGRRFPRNDDYCDACDPWD